VGQETLCSSLFTPAKNALGPRFIFGTGNDGVFCSDIDTSSLVFLLGSHKDTRY
jgi:hypothetical protein